MGFIPDEIKFAQIVISGAGLVACLGANRQTVWDAVRRGQCGVGSITALGSALPAGADGGQAVEIPDSSNPELPREIRYLRYAIIQALADAGIADQATSNELNCPYPPHRRGIILGTTLHGMSRGGRFLRSGNPAGLRYFLATSVLREATNGMGIEGPALTTCSACSSSLGSIVLAMTLLQSGQLDMVIAGGYDPISEYAYAGFNSLRLIANGPLRPFARDRRGMKVGEGYGIVVLERLADAQARGHKNILAEIRGFGESADAHHLTQPRPDGDGASRAIRGAIISSGLKLAEIDLIAAHATGTPDNDAAEYAALKAIWLHDLPRVSVVGFKSHLSHTLGAAGAVELILSAMAMENQIVPPTANVQGGDSDFSDLNLSSGEEKKRRIEATLNLSLGFGGANTCVILSPANRSQSSGAKAITTQDVLITGIGILFPGITGNFAFREHFSGGYAERSDLNVAKIDETVIANILNARRVRRMSEYVKYSLAAATLALQDADISDIPDFCQSCCAMLATTHGSINFCADYYGQIIREGIAAANPLLFAEGVPNVAAAHLSMTFGIKGACQTLIGSRTSGLDVLGLAANRIATGEWNRAIICAGEEYCPVLDAAYKHCGLADMFPIGCGAVAMVLESRQSLENRKAAYGTVTGYSAASPAESKNIESAIRILDDLRNPSTVISSSNGTWIDRIESSAISRSFKKAGAEPMVASIGRCLPECFSVTPLAGIAAMLLSTKLPTIGNDSSVTQFAALATDYTGLMAGVGISRF